MNILLEGIVGLVDHLTQYTMLWLIKAVSGIVSQNKDMDVK